MLYCQHAKISNLTEFIASPWIRPDDLRSYQDIGISHFKIDGRDRAPQYVLDVVESYHRGGFEGNFLYLTHSGVPRSVEEVARGRRALVPIAIDNRALDGFLRPFEEERIVCRGQCATCGYCDQVASRAIVYDAEWRESLLANWQETARRALDQAG